MRASDLISEKKKRKKKARSSTSVVGSAAWGPGPYGGYGFATGYSGDGGGMGGDGGGGGESVGRESDTDLKKRNIKAFALWCLKQLDITKAPTVKLVDDTGTTALGYIDRETKTIVVTIKGRHQMDIMRTLAHELTHYKQMETRDPDGETGSDDENSANSIAGILLRNWGKMHPDMFTQHLAETWNKLKNEGRVSQDIDNRIGEDASAGATVAANVSVGAVYPNKPAKSRKNKNGTIKNALDSKDSLMTGGSLLKR
jgi:hypothetical protein